MKNNIVITIDKIKQNVEFRKLINALPLENIQLINQDGTLERISQKTINHFRSTGLNNFDFFATEYWKNYE